MGTVRFLLSTEFVRQMLTTRFLECVDVPVSGIVSMDKLITSKETLLNSLGLTLLRVCHMTNVM